MSHHETSLQIDMFTGTEVDARTPTQLRLESRRVRDEERRRQLPPTTLFADRDMVQFGVTQAHPKATVPVRDPLQAIPREQLAVDPRTPEEIEEDRMREAEKLTVPMFPEQKNTHDSVPVPLLCLPSGVPQFFLAATSVVTRETSPSVHEPTRVYTQWTQKRAEIHREKQLIGSLLETQTIYPPTPHEKRLPPGVSPPMAYALSLRQETSSIEDRPTEPTTPHHRRDEAIPIAWIHLGDIARYIREWKPRFFL